MGELPRRTTGLLSSIAKGFIVVLDIYSVIPGRDSGFAVIGFFPLLKWSVLALYPYLEGGDLCLEGGHLCLEGGDRPLESSEGGLHILHGSL